jgi:superfamily II DNA or RNA helicase
VLVLAPKPLIWQWQDELLKLLDLPSAVWDGQQWVDENGLEHPARGPGSIRDCPRRVGIVSTGLITRGSEVADWLVSGRYECVVVDEAHRARRKNLRIGHEYDAQEPNNLLAFIQQISARTHSLLLATATPVQMHPVEAWDLLDALARGSDAVLGSTGSPWRNARAAVELVTGQAPLPDDDVALWDWLRNPLPPPSEGRDYQLLRGALDLPEDAAYAPGSSYPRLRQPDLARIRRVFPQFVQRSNPLLRHIVLRTREYLEQTIDPETQEPYLKRMAVTLHGEGDDEAIVLPSYLRAAYGHAEAFCKLLAKRAPAAGYLKTLLLRRIGSSLVAGRLTAEKMLAKWVAVTEEGDDDDAETVPSELKQLTADEGAELERLVSALAAAEERDPKYQVVLRCLRDWRWKDLGCIVFSQYFDTAWWAANRLSRDFPDTPIGLYAGGARSGLLTNGLFTTAARDALKDRVRRGELRILVGTDAASEGLNLQRLGTLINLDLPWNPSRLEQRKGRIQRIGQVRDVVDIYNLRYAESVEDRVHQLLGQRLQGIYQLFGQLPDILEDAWVQVALGDLEKAGRTIDAVPRQHPFPLRYHRVERVEWESCARVLQQDERRRHLSMGWRPSGVQ